MDKKVILLTDFYLPNNNANGLCIHRIGKAFQKNGYEVHVISYMESGLKEEECYEGIYVHRVRPQFFYYLRAYYYKNADRALGKLCWSMALLVRRLKKILFMPWYPLVSPLACKRYYKKVECIAQKYGVKNIVAGYNPFESATASVWLKKSDKYKVVTYFMDTFTMTANAQKHKIIYKTGQKWEKKIYSIVDGVANFPTYKNHFKTEFYQNYQDKMIYAGVPIDFNELSENIQKEKYFQNDCINLLYTGGLSMGDRDPIYTSNLMDKLEISNVLLHFFSRGDAEEYLKQNQNKKIVSHGQVPYKELLSARADADFMINIGSQREIILPSRLFEYIATGKPIIHIAYRKDDPCIYYLAKHPYALVIHADEDLVENTRLLHNFILTNKDKFVSADILEKTYYENSAENMVKSFEKFFAE